jgi:hypothetical protein
MVNFAALLSAQAAKRAPTPLIYVEDIFVILRQNWYDCDLREVLLNDQWFEKFVDNVHGWVVQRKALTTEQARIALRIIAKTKLVLIENGWATADEVDRLIKSPRYRMPLTQSSNVPREVRYLGDNLLGFRFKRNDNIVEIMKNFADDLGEPLCTWDWISRLWIMPVVRETIQPIMEIIRDNRFGFDDDVAEYLALVTNAQDEPSTFVIDPNSGKIIATVNDHEIMAAWTISALAGEVE